MIHSSAASVEASRVLHAAGGSLSAGSAPEQPARDVSREPPRVMAAICTCSNSFQDSLDPETLQHELEKDPCVDRVLMVAQSCTTSGWEELVAAAENFTPNRILIGACHPYLFISKLRELGRRINLDPACMDVVDIMSPIIASRTKPASGWKDAVLSSLNMALSRLKHIEPLPVGTVPVCRQALVVGGGIAGLHAALAVADHGYPVNLVEQGDTLGGNLHWLRSTLAGESTTTFL
ncbi:MAG: FAD-binding protein, partial [Desulfobacterales bacterium]|nr:FAD-binding protein [Desulfobacterales bacterium]